MYKSKIWAATICIGMAITGCKVPALTEVSPDTTTPASFGTGTDTANTAVMSWRNFFTDPNLQQLIDTALKYNQELNMTLQEIAIARADIKIKHAALLPTVTAGAGAGIEKVGRYTSQGAGDASTEIEPGKEVPDVLSNFNIAAYATWEVDVWKKLRTSKQAAITRWLATVEGRNFVLTSLIGEIASTYYELVALDSRLSIVKQSIALQQNALGIVRAQKEGARATELGVKKFEAEVLKSQSLEYDILQDIRETENKLHMLMGRYPSDITREKRSILDVTPSAISAGIPSQLLTNRPDVKQAELGLKAAHLDVKVARAEFLPSFGITAAFGLNAFKPSYLVKFPESVIFSMVGDMVAPLINKNAIKGEFNKANAEQVRSLYNYEKTILNAYLEVNTQLARISNLSKSYSLKSQQVNALNQSIDISNDLFKSARADYFEVLMTQRDALDAKLELIENRKDQMLAVVGVYRGIGGGWR